MADIFKSIKANGTGDYSTVTLWEFDIPPNMVSAAERWIGGVP
jgi:hypothetical protein